jgi:hypothetical protein
MLLWASHRAASAYARRICAVSAGWISWVRSRGKPGLEIDPDREKHERATTADIETTGAEDKAFAGR